MSSNIGHSVLPWMITLLYVVSIALFVMATWHFQHEITTHKEQIQQLSKRLALLEEQQNDEGTTVKTTVSTESDNTMIKRQLIYPTLIPAGPYPPLTIPTIPTCLCSSGLPGRKGERGYTGRTGAKGARGYTGSPGIKGQRGYTGYRGLKGYRGYTGEPGPPGLMGQKGVKGDVGSPGAGRRGQKGQKGRRGIQGNMGPAGPVGPKGEHGLPGPQGANGPMGYNGTAGMPGPPGPQGPTSDQAVGTTYIRWGHDNCPNTADVVYSGKVAGATHSNKGGGSSAQCLPNDPEYVNSTNISQKKAYMYGAQYDNSLSAYNQDIPCAVCYANRSTTYMMPAKFTCPSGWTKEYHGYLMTSLDYQPKVEYVCVDTAFKGAIRRSKIDKGLLLYPVEVKCQSLPCPPFNATMDMMCVLCTK